MARTTDIIVKLPGGRRVDAHLRGHVVRTDQPKDNGGDDGAVSPFELFLASIGTCAGIFIQGFCAARQLDFSAIEIEERAEVNDEGVLTAVRLEVRLPKDFPEKYRAAIVKVAEQCSVKKAIAAQPSISVATSLG